MRLSIIYWVKLVIFITLLFGVVSTDTVHAERLARIEITSPEDAQGQEMVNSWRVVKHLDPKIKLNPNVLERVTSIRSAGKIPVEKFDDAMNKQLGQILNSADEINANKILDRLQEAHVNEKHFDDITDRLSKYSDVTDELAKNPEQFEFFDEVLRFPEKYRELAQVGSIQTSSPLYKWALGKFRKQILGNAEVLEKAVSSNIDNYINIPSGYKKTTQATLKGTKKTRPDDLIYSIQKEIDEITSETYYRAIIHDTKLHGDVPWTPNQYDEIVKKFEQGAEYVELELRTAIPSLKVGDKIRVYKQDFYKSIGTPDKSGTYLSTKRVFE